MNLFLNKKKVIFFSIGFFILCFVFLFSKNFYSTVNVLAKKTDNIYGWGWSSNFGWISLNCNNYYNDILEDRCEPVDYGVNMDAKTGNLEKFGWSSNLGWVKFNPDGPYPEEPFYSTKTGKDGLIRGWAKAYSLWDDGWIKFLGKDCDNSLLCKVSGKSPNYILDSNIKDGQSSICYNCDKYKKSCVKGGRNGLSCSSNKDCGDEGTCTGKYVLDKNGELFCALCFSNHLPEKCSENNEDQCFNSEKYPVATICSLNNNSQNGQQEFCTGCFEYQNNPPNEKEKITLCSTCPKCYEYGVGINYSTNRLAGWAWQGSNSNKGVGWIQFNPDYTIFHGPWLQTELGSIYAKGNVGSQLTFSPPGKEFSSTYEILAGGSITHFSSKAGENFSYEDFDSLEFPKTENVYANALGKIDFAGIYAGQYGKVIQIKSINDINSVLGGNVYLSNGDLVLNTELEFMTGDLVLQNGSGLIIVEGNLKIEKNIKYSNLAVTKLKQLPSVAFIVKGDIIISPYVSEIVGAFITLGNNNSKECPILLSESFGCGRFSTGQSLNKLDIKGLVFAKQFNFERSYFSTERGAEKIIYDGRVLANTPPGLGDITKVLPVFKEVNN